MPHLCADAAKCTDVLSAATPLHLPHLIGPMQHYLWILKTTHSGADMDTSMEMAKGSLDDSLRWTLYDILKNRHASLSLAGCGASAWLPRLEVWLPRGDLA